MRPASRRVLVFWIVSLAIAAAAGAWFHHLLSEPTTEERVREEAERIRQRVHSATH